MTDIIVFHHNKCSKSNEVVEFLQSQNRAFVLVDYLKSPWTESTMKELIKQLINPELLLRDGEIKSISNFPQKMEYDSLESIAHFIVQNPEVIQRPIVVINQEAMVARPFENFENWFNTKTVTE